MSKVKLTKSFMDKVLPPTDGKPEHHWDTEVRGYAARVMPSGKKSFFVQGRCNGKSIKKNIGPYGVWTPDQARDKAKDMLRDMDNGIHPDATARAEKAEGMTLRDVADAYLRDRPLKPNSVRSIEWHITHSFKAWSGTRFASIDQEKVTKRYNEIKANGVYIGRPSPSQANQAFAVLRSLWNYYIEEQERQGSTLPLVNPVVRALKKRWSPVRPVTRRIPESKIGAVYASLLKARQNPHSDDTLSAIDLVTFLLFTGARVGEGGSLKWADVNLKEKWWHIADPKNRNPVWLPLSRQAVELLTTRYKNRVNEYVFHSRSAKGCMGDPRSTMENVSKVAGCKITPHDLRRTFSVIAHSYCDIALDKIERLTNHVPKSVTERHYLESQQLQHLRPEVQRVADWIVKQASLDTQRVT